MRGYWSKVVILLILSILVRCEEKLNLKPAVAVKVDLIPKIVVPLLIRNKAHILPYFFSFFENLDYPKDKISLWIRSDHNEDDSISITKLWLNRVEKLYHSVNFAYDETETTFNLSSSRVDWSYDRYSHVIALKEEALEFARKSWADYVFFCDVDVLLTDEEILTRLINLKLPIVSPMLLSADLVYSNFWTTMKNYHMERDEEYFNIVKYEKVGDFNVPMVHSSVLVNLNYEPTKMLTFEKKTLIQRQIDNNIEDVDYDVPFDDIIVFAVSATKFNIPLVISNLRYYGFIDTPASNSYEDEFSKFLDLKILILARSYVLPVNEEFRHLITYPKKHKLTFDNIYMINLERRPEKRETMELLFRELGLEYEYFEAVDGKKLTPSMVSDMGIKYLEGYVDHYNNRPMRLAEVGCFLSHYKIWEQMISRGEKEILILEDDVRFYPRFVENSLKTLKQAREQTDWDFLYFGRWSLYPNATSVQITENIVSVEYSYWAVGYAITLEGAKKLVNANPLKSLIPVDEFIPVMYNSHRNDTWLNAFPNRNLIAYSASPLLLTPQFHPGDCAHISDTSVYDDDDSTLDLNAPNEKENLGKSKIKEKIEL